MQRRHSPLRPDRMRSIQKPFGWIPFSILASGILEQLSPAAQQLYFFLCLAADAQGMSFYGDRRLCSILKLPEPAIALARRELQYQDLLAFDGMLYQLLSLPSQPVPPISPATLVCKAPQQVGRILQALGWDNQGA